MLGGLAGGAGCGGGSTASCDGCGEFREVMGAFCDVLERCPLSTTASEYLCQEKRGAGESCSGSEDCQSAFCSQGVCLLTNQCVMP